MHLSQSRNIRQHPIRAGCASRPQAAWCRECGPTPTQGICRCIHRQQRGCRLHPRSDIVPAGSRRFRFPNGMSGSTRHVPRSRSGAGYGACSRRYGTWCCVPCGLPMHCLWQTVWQSAHIRRHAPGRVRSCGQTGPPMCLRRASWGAIRSVRIR